jgi:WD40 repeat protein
LVWASYTSDGRHIIGVGGDNVDSANGPSSAARVAEWDARSGALVGAPMKLPSVAGLGLASNRDGSRVLVGLAAGQAALVDPAHGKVIKMLPVGGGAVFGVAMSPDGRELATGDSDGFVQLWNAATGRRIGVDMKSVSGLVVGLQFTADGRSLLATGGDGTVRMWDETTQRAIGNPFPTQDQNWAYGVISPDRSTFVVAYSDGQVYEWPAALRSWEGHACVVARRSFTKAEWSQFVGSRYPHPKLCQ